MTNKKEEIEEFEEDEIDEENFEFDGDEYKNFCIDLDDKFRILADKRNYILQTRSIIKEDCIKKIGKNTFRFKKGDYTKWSNFYYCNSISELLRGYVTLKVRASGIKTLKGFRSASDDVVRSLESLCVDNPAFEVKIKRKRTK